ncbi:MAG: hypothetical protein O2819_05465 [Planctomycetota bacterium]|nr:hypothetical protein [Planctomycetota bacterium]MDA1106364.1 hypothetical protein [Planctomycetota bacterium]
MPRRPTSPIPPVSPSHRREWELWLLQVTSIPTASGREHLVQAWIDGWLESRLDRVRVHRDAAGNVLITRRDAPKGRSTRPVLVTAHLDHPAFVVTKRGASGKALRGTSARSGASTIELEFRGGVLDPYFHRARIEIIDREGIAHAARITALDPKAKPFKRVTASLMARGTAARCAAASAIAKGDIGRWALPAPRIGEIDLEPLPGPAGGPAHASASRSASAPRPRRARCLQTHACDDLAAVVAALAAFDLTLRSRAFAHLGLLLTTAEEVGFIGAIHAARTRFVPPNSLLVNLENSRSFPHDSPMGAGPILRVGDRMSVFTPSLTNTIGDALAAHAAARPAFQWQRKLMPGGACESTAFAAYGIDSTCLCLPLGNYHNMGRLGEVQAALARGARPRAQVAPETIAIDDFHGLVEMIAVAALALAPRAGARTAPSAHRSLMEKLYAEKSVVLRS